MRANLPARWLARLNLFLTRAAQLAAIFGRRIGL